MSAMKKMLIDILSTHSPSGNEEVMLQKYSAYIAPFVDDIFQDSLGNMIALKRGYGEGRKKLMIAAHADEIGLIVTYIDNNGYIYFQEVGAVDTNILPGQRVDILHGNNIVTGVIGKKPLHLQDKSEYAKDWMAEDLWIDIGVCDRQEALSRVDVGDYVTFHSCPEKLNEKVVTGRAMDNKMGIYSMIEIARSLEGNELESDIYFVATVQEEIGGRGAGTSAFGIQPDIAVVIDSTHATDYPSVSPRRSGEIKLGCGCVIAQGPNICRGLSDRLIEIARKEKMDYQVQAISHPTGTDANPIQISANGVRTALISIPCRYMHTSNEIVNLNDINNTVKLLNMFCQRGVE